MGEKIYIPVGQTIPRIIPNTYGKKGSGSKYKLVKWVMDKMWDFLHKKGYIEQVVTFEHLTDSRVLELDLDRLDEQICRCENAILQIHNRKADTIILGGNIMDKIHNNLRHSGQLTHWMTGESKYGMIGMHTDIGRKSARLQYRGFKVVMVPWFEGFLLCNMEDR
jgi:hypothetical protein